MLCHYYVLLAQDDGSQWHMLTSTAYVLMTVCLVRLMNKQNVSLSLLLLMVSCV